MSDLNIGHGKDLFSFGPLGSKKNVPNNFQVQRAVFVEAWGLSQEQYNNEQDKLPENSYGSRWTPKESERAHAMRQWSTQAFQFWYNRAYSDQEVGENKTTPSEGRSNDAYPSEAKTAGEAKPNPEPQVEAKDPPQRVLW